MSFNYLCLSWADFDNEQDLIVTVLAAMSTEKIIASKVRMVLPALGVPVFITPGTLADGCLFSLGFLLPFPLSQEMS